MPWRLTDGTYWREDGDDAVVVNARSVLRLDPRGASHFRRLLSPTPGQLAEETEVQAWLIAEGMIEAVVEPADPRAALVPHLPSNGGSP